MIFWIIGIKRIFFNWHKNTSSNFFIRISWQAYCHIPDTGLGEFYTSAEMQSMNSFGPVDDANSA